MRYLLNPILKRFRKFFSGPISIEVTTTNVEAIIEEAKK